MSHNITERTFPNEDRVIHITRKSTEVNGVHTGHINIDNGPQYKCTLVGASQNQTLGKFIHRLVINVTAAKSNVTINNGFEDFAMNVEKGTHSIEINGSGNWSIITSKGVIVMVVGG